MKSLLYLLLLFALPAVAQKIKIDENSVVKDSATGFVYPYAVWQPILQKGTHKLIAENPADPKTAFFIVRIPVEEKDAKFAKMSKPAESRFFRTGKNISLYNLTDIDGNKFSVQDLKGKIVVMNFWFINCRPCRMEIPDLNEVVAHYINNDKVVFLALGLDQEFEIKNFIKEMPFSYNLIPFARNIVANYGVQSFPTHVIIDGEGKVYFHTTGLAPNTVYWVRKSIDELLARDEKKLASN